MKSRKLMIAALLTALAVPVLAVGFNDNPPGPAGGPGTNWQAPAGPGSGAYPRNRLSLEQREQLRQQLLAMNPQERRAFMREWRQKSGTCQRYRDGFAPAPQGGPGMAPNRGPMN